MRLELCTWPEVERYLERSSGIIIPIGSTEQHGPNGLIGTDAICSETIAVGVSEEADALVAPTLSIGMAQHHLAFPGTIALRPSTLLAVVRDVVLSLARHGFKRCYFLNGHGGNIATVQAAFSELYATMSFSPANESELRLRLCSWYTGARVQTLAREMFGDGEGSHATPSEVSLSFFAYPDAVKSAAISPRIAPSGGFYHAQDFRQRFPDGRIGSDPSLATVEAGKRIYHAAVAEVLGDYREFLALE
jgi:creatinine amidohydrolase